MSKFIFMQDEIISVDEVSHIFNVLNEQKPDEYAALFVMKNGSEFVVELKGPESFNEIKKTLKYAV